ncbi:3-hydroxyisobutyryl-CoA hydrolase, mitochondrial [Aplochiton taeniatus]
MPSVRKLKRGRHWTLQQDNDPKCTSKSIKPLHEFAVNVPGRRVGSTRLQDALHCPHLMAKRRRHTLYVAALERALVDLRSPTIEDVSRLLDSYQKQSALDAEKPFVLQQHIDDINRLFNSSSMEGILHNMKIDGSPFAQIQAEVGS